MEKLSAPQAAKLLGISLENLKILEKQGLIHPTLDIDGLSFYSSSEITRLNSKHNLTLSEEATQVGIGIQREMASSIVIVRRVMVMAGVGFLAYSFLVVLLALLFILSPIQTAGWVGLTPKEKQISFLQSKNPKSKVLAAATSQVAKNSPSPLQVLLQPVSKASLGLVKYAAPSAYEQVAQRTILDPNDILSLDSNGTITPVLPITIPQSSSLDIATSELVTNLNSEFLQGKQPGTDPGDIAIVGATVSTSTPSAAIAVVNAATSGAGDFTTINGLTITNNGTNTLTIAGGKTLTASNSITFTGTDGTTFSFPSSGDDVVGRTVSQTLLNKTIAAQSNTISGITNGNLSGGAGITNANLAFSSINVNAGPGISVTGSPVHLGETITITNTGSVSSAGVGSITGTANQIIASAPTGALTLSLPQDIGLSNLPSFAGLSLTNTSNQLVFGTTNTGTLSWSPSTSRVLTLPDATDTLVGKATTDILTNKTLAAGSNTVSGITNTNLSGSAGITNANLANSSITVVGGTGITVTGSPVSLGGSITIDGTGSGSGGLTSVNADLGSALVSPGGTLTLTGAGITSISGSGSTLTVTTTEADTLDAVIARGADTTTHTTFNDGITVSTINGLTIIGAGILAMVGDKKLTVLNTLEFGGTDDTSFVFPTTSDDVVGRTVSQTLTNKTLAAGSNTISGLTNTNLSGSAGISNANLASSSITVVGGSGISVTGSPVSLGGSITISGSGSGVSSITGTANQIIASAPTGALTLSLPQDIGLSSLPSFAGLSLTNTSNQLVLGTTNTGTLSWSPSTSRVLTLPDTTDTLVGKATTDILTNKTLAAGSNTISGLTNTNLSGLAGITNANLANSSITTNGNSGSGSVALGGALTFTGSGITSVTAAGSNLTFASTEADTLQSVYARGNTITTTTGNGIIVDSSAATVTGTISGVTILAPNIISGTGIYNSIKLGTSSSPTANTYDQATIAVGNLASTAQQNFATLNITNGGTGFLDVELIRGFINYQGMNTLYDDFTSKSIDTADRWTSTSTGTGSNCAILAGGLNGLFRMHSGGGINRGCELTTQAITTLADGYYQRGNNPILETKLKIDVVTNARIFAGFTEERVAVGSDTNANTNHAYIAKRSTDTTWQCVTDDGGATETITDTGVTIIANTFYRLRVELRSGTTPETICTVDNGTTVARTVVTATQPGATIPMDVYVKLGQSDTVIKNMDVDYVRAWQDDPPLALNSGSDLTEAGGNLTPETATISAVETSSSTTSDEADASDSGNLVELVTSSVNNFFKNIVEFFGNVIFHADVVFLGHTTFNVDTAGHSLIKAGQSEVSVTFEKEYTTSPVVTASINLASGEKVDEIPGYAVYGVSTKGFKIKLSKNAVSDLSFSWIALAVNRANITNGVSVTPVLYPTPNPSPVTSEIQPSPIQEIAPSQTPTAESTPIQTEQGQVGPTPIKSESTAIPSPEPEAASSSANTL